MKRDGDMAAKPQPARRRWVTPAQVAQRAKTSLSSVYRRVRDGAIVAGKVGGRIRVSLDGSPPYKYCDVPNKAVFRPGEVAAFLDVSVSTIYRMVRDGELPDARVRKQIRIPRNAILAYIDHVDDLGLSDGE